MTTRVRAHKLVGELTVSTAAERKTELLAAVERMSRVDLDLSGIEELDTAGLQVLLLARREASRLGKEFRLLRPSAAVLGALEIVRFDLALDPGVPA